MDKYEIGKTICEEILSYHNFNDYDELIKFISDTLNIKSEKIRNILGELLAKGTIYKDKNGFFRCI